MKRLSVLTLSVMLAIAMASFAGSYAQQRIARTQLVGTWTLVSCVNAKGNTPPFCVNPNGRIMFDAGGSYTTVIAAGGRPRLADAPRAARSAEEYKSVAMGLVAGFGTWAFNEADQTVTFHVEGALFPQNEGTDEKYSVSLGGDELKAVGSDGGGLSIWRRAR